MLVLTVILVFLESLLRAGPFGAPDTLVYGRPETWDGFWDVVLAEQFRGSLIGPFDDPPGKIAALVDRTSPPSVRSPRSSRSGSPWTANRRPRYALLSGTAVGITCFFAAAYVNAVIYRYYVVPALIAWTWLALLAAGPATLAGISIEGAPARIGSSPWRWRLGSAGPPIAAAPRAATGRRPQRRCDGATWIDRARDHASGCGRRQLWSYSTPLWYAQLVEDRRPDIDIIDDRTRLDRNLGDINAVIDANLPTRPVYVTASSRPDRESGIATSVTAVGADGGPVLPRILGRRETAG